MNNTAINNRFACMEYMFAQKDWDISELLRASATNPTVAVVPQQQPDSLFKTIIEQKQYPPAIIIITHSDGDDDVSVLYDDPDVDDDQCLPEITIDVLHVVFDEIEDASDGDEYDSDDEDEK